MYELYRDDDISVTSNITLLREVHELFIKHNKIHTVAVVMKNIWDNKEVWYWLMTAKNLRIGLHGWTHADYSDPGVTASWDIELSLRYFKEMAERGRYNVPQINTFYPPWNRVGSELQDACNTHGLILDSRVGGEVYNFHYWACQDDRHIKELEEALKQ